MWLILDIHSCFVNIHSSISNDPLSHPSPQSSLLSELVALSPRTNLVVPRTNRRISMEDGSETNIALNPVLASRIFGGETSLASSAENLIHLLECTALGFGHEEVDPGDTDAGDDAEEDL
jgi:hypothetical protein